MAYDKYEDDFHRVVLKPALGWRKKYFFEMVFRQDFLSDLEGAEVQTWFPLLRCVFLRFSS